LQLELPVALRPLLEQALRLRAMGRWPQAAEAALRLRNAVPGAIPPALLAAECVLPLDRYRLARELVLGVARPPVTSAESLLQLVRWLRRFEEPELTERLVGGSPWRRMGPPELLAELALHLGSSGLYRMASDCVEHALSSAPNNANLHYLRGLFRMFGGDTSGSVEALQHALRLRPGMANAHLSLAMQDAAGSADTYIADIRRALANVRNDEETGYLAYALHHRLHALGEYDEAWQVLERGHAARRRITPYSRVEQDDLFARLKGLALPPFEPAPQDGTGLIFIVGMFRSGTSLIERVLGGHPDVVDGGETWQLSACLRQVTDHDSMRVLDATIVARASIANFAEVCSRMLRYAAWRSGGKPWLTEKLPSNFLNLGFILHAFPEARIVHMRRDPMDTCFSNLRTFFSGAAPYACDPLDMADYYLRYRDLMAHWHALAPGRILDVDYAAFVADPEGQARRLLDYCRLEFQPEILELGRRSGTSATASAAHVRRGVLKDRGQAWKPYAAHLDAMREALSPAYKQDA
jgi:tetratricopeptide (TPR) repeat protein